LPDGGYHIVFQVWLEPIAGMDTQDTSASNLIAAEGFNLPAAGVAITSAITGNTYTIGNVIGEGSFGIVYECVDVWRNSLVAKVLKPPLGSTNTAEANALEELTKLLVVRHPNITHVFDAFQFNGACYIISERCDRTLADMMAQQNFSGRSWSPAVARCLLQAVHFAHVQGIAHCDIHAGNVLLRFIPDELLPLQHHAVTFKLGDFGLAKAFGALDPNGTFLEAIRPPEAINSVEFGPLDHRVDIYHVGLLLLQLQLKSPRVFLRDEILNGVPRDLALSLDAPYSFALEKALRRHVDFRTSTAIEFWRDLNSPAS
jgi:serine/threonine protein kinase